jgi:AcrR family transcriptional regulator
MARPSQNTDLLLKKAALEMIPKTGISGLNVRAVARHAGVNPGMFAYHFKTKDKFIEALLTDVYADFFKNFSITATSGGTCREQLRHAIIHIAFFVRDHRQLLLPLFEEILSGNEKILDFALKNMTQHVSVVIRLVRECQKKGYIVKMPWPGVAIMLIAPVVGPSFAARVCSRYSKRLKFKMIEVMVEKLLLSDKEITRRIDIALKGLSTSEASR